MVVLELVKNKPSFSLGLIVFYFIGTMLSIANYVAYFRYHEGRYGRDVVNAALAFTVLGTIGYALIAAVCWVWAFKYVTDGSERLNKVGWGMIAIFLLHDFPLFIIQFHAYLCCGGLYHGLQGTVFVYQWFEFLLSFSFAWQGYAWIVAGYLEANFGAGYGLGGGSSAGLKTGSETLHVLPPAPGSSRSQASEMSVPLLPTEAARGADPRPLRGSPRDFGPAERDFRTDDHRLPSPRRNNGGGGGGGYASSSGNMMVNMIPIEDPNYRGPSMDGGRNKGGYIPVDRNVSDMRLADRLGSQGGGSQGGMRVIPMDDGGYARPPSYSPSEARSGGTSMGGGGGYSPGVVPPPPGSNSGRGGSIYMERAYL